MLFSLAHLIAFILPSIPLDPKPGATITPSKFDISLLIWSLSINSEWIEQTSTLVSLIDPAWINDSKIDLYIHAILIGIIVQGFNFFKTEEIFLFYVNISFVYVD